MRKNNFLICVFLILIGCSQDNTNRNTDVKNNYQNNNPKNSVLKPEYQENNSYSDMSMLMPNMMPLSMSDEYGDTFSDMIAMSYFRLENVKNFDDFLENFSIGSELQIFIDPNHFMQYKLNMKYNTNYHFMLYSKKGCVLTFESVIDKSTKHIEPTSEIITGGDINHCINAQQEFAKFNEFFQNQLHYKIENNQLILYNSKGVELAFSENKSSSTLFFNELGL